MSFEIPTADRTRLDQLLAVLGDRADDFKKCFDIESEWCWKYADLMLRGMEQRELEYAEGHHVVPACFYGKRNNTVNEGNLTTLTFGEHLYAHYCAALCGLGRMKGKMAMAFRMMYNFGISKTRHVVPEETEFIESIAECELKRIRSMEPRINSVEAEGRTHTYEDIKQYHRDYEEANKERIKAYRLANKDRIIERNKAYREVNKEKLAQKRKVYRKANKEKIAAIKKASWERHREKNIKHKKAYYEANKEIIAKHKKDYVEANKEKIYEQRKTSRERNKEKIAKRMKAYREANKEKLHEKDKAYYKLNKEKICEYQKTYRKANKEKIYNYHKAYRAAKRAAGYALRNDPTTGKQVWVFVGLPTKQEAA